MRPHGGGVFVRTDLWTGLVVGALALFIYSYTLSPGVTLEDSGELIVAAYNLGVPHPPGYPIWTVLAWLFTLLPLGTVAWRVNLLSAVFGAAAVGLAAMVTAATVRLILAAVPAFRGRIGAGDRERIGVCVALAAGLMLAMSAGLWSQAVIAEVYTLNAFFFMAIVALVFAWTYRPEHMSLLYWMAFLFGLGLTNHQTLVLMLPAFLPPIWLNNRRLFWQLLMFGAGLLGLMAWLGGMATAGAWGAVREGTAARGGLIAFGLVGLGLALLSGHLSRARLWPLHLGLFLGLVLAGVALYYATTGSRPEFIADLERTGAFGRPRLLLAAAALLALLFVALAALRRGWVAPWVPPYLMVLAVALGLSFYLYMPLASRTNPPLNWGYAKTVQGFWHHVKRGQYEQLNLGRTLDVAWLQLRSFWGDFQQQFGALPFFPFMRKPFFYLPYAVYLGLLSFAAYPWLGRRGRAWFQFNLIAFLVQSLGFIFLNNPDLDIHSLFTQRVFFILAHCVFATWLGAGMAVVLGWMLSRGSGAPGEGGAAAAGRGGWLDSARWRLAGRAGMALIFLLPTLCLRANWRSCEARGHDFGHLFGYEILKDMPPGSILFGGTDPGRFVPTYFINCPSVDGKRFKPDVFLITQNALADSTYMQVLHDQFSPDSQIYSPDGDSGNDYRGVFAALARARCTKERIWIPAPDDLKEAFRQFVEESERLQEVPGGGTLAVDPSGKVNVTGVGAVMRINAILARMIWEQNRARHAFFVEESYVIPWMYPYLEPFGLIMRLHAAPLDRLSGERIEEDFRYWQGLIDALVVRPEYRRDEVAAKTFGKLRSSIGGLYLYWANRTREQPLFEHAERALRQALALYRALPEANYRLTELFLQQDRQEDALEILDGYQAADPLNARIAGVIERVRQSRELRDRQRELAGELAEHPDDVETALALAEVYSRRNKWSQMNEVINGVLGRGVTEELARRVLDLYRQAGRSGERAQVLEALVEKRPDDWRLRADLAGDYAHIRDLDRMRPHLERALARGGAEARREVLADPRFEYLRAQPEFRMLLGLSPLPQTGRAQGGAPPAQ